MNRVTITEVNSELEEVRRRNPNGLKKEKIMICETYYVHGARSSVVA
jgi:hypothetical protein